MNPSHSAEEPDSSHASPFPIAPTDGAYTYTVIRNEDGPAAERDALIAVRKTLETVYGSAPKPETNYTTENLSEEEISARIELLIGRTGRPESDTVYDTLGENDYTIRTVGNKLVILGKNESLTMFAVDAFKRVIKDAPQTIKEDYNMTKSYIAGSYAGSYDFAALGYTKLTDVRFEVRRGVDVDEILYLTSDTHNYTYGYYSNNAWVDEDIIIAARSDTDDPPSYRNTELVAVDIYNEEVWQLEIYPRG
jgi:hypothetical protein